MPKKNTQTIPFDDRNLPVNSLSKEKMDELEKRLAPYVEEIKQKLRAELEEKKKAFNNP